MSSQCTDAVRRTFAALYQERSGAAEEQAGAWLTALASAHRYLADIWPSN